jgi:hypothetical protein
MNISNLSNQNIKNYSICSSRRCNIVSSNSSPVHWRRCNIVPGAGCPTSLLLVEGRASGRAIADEDVEDVEVDDEGPQGVLLCSPDDSPPLDDRRPPPPTLSGAYFK